MYELTTLENGLRVLTVTMPHLQSVSLGFFVGVGSRYESDALAGSSHFIEHMLFKGTPRRPSALEIAEAIEGKGGICNASTGVESTLYWAKCAAAHLPGALDVLSDMLLHATFDAGEIEKERAVIHEEITYALDTPEGMAQLLVNQLQWPNHPLGRDVAGTRQSVAGLSRQGLLGYLADHYHPGKIVLGVAGRATHEEVLALVRSYLEEWEPRPRLQFEPAPPCNGRSGPCLQIGFKDTEQAQLSFSFSGLCRSHPDLFTLRLLNILLGEGMRSRLFQEVRERLGLAYSVGSYVMTVMDTGTVGVYAGVAPEKAEETIRAILSQLDLMRQNPVPELELETAREFIRGRLALSLEDSFTLAAWYARQELLEPQVLEPEDSIALIDRVQVADIQRLAQDLFRTEQLNLAIVGPFSETGDRFRRALYF
jgi:predicted Zn-dependent peptidase